MVRRGPTSPEVGRGWEISPQLTSIAETFILWRPSSSHSTPEEFFVGVVLQVLQPRVPHMIYLSIMPGLHGRRSLVIRRMPLLDRSTSCVERAQETGIALDDTKRASAAHLVRRMAACTRLFAGAPAPAMFELPSLPDPDAHVGIYAKLRKSGSGERRMQVGAAEERRQVMLSVEPHWWLGLGVQKAGQARPWD